METLAASQNGLRAVRFGKASNAISWLPTIEQSNTAFPLLNVERSSPQRRGAPMRRSDSPKGAIVANFAGRGVAAAVSLLFVPVYLRLLGVEAYGLVGVFSVLTGTLRFLDLGLSKAVARELAVLSGHPDKEDAAWSLVRAGEIIYWVVAIVIGLGVTWSSQLIVMYWLKPQSLSVETVQKAVAIMGCLVAIQWPTSLYSGVLVGLQRQVLLNVITASLGFAQGATVVSALCVFGASIKVFFVSQAAFGLFSIALLRVAAYRVLPRTDSSLPSWNLWALSGVVRFAGGVTAISVLATLLTQVDKILLTKLLDLEAFGTYSIALALAGAAGIPSGLVSSAVFPRFVELAARRDTAALNRLYHESSQLLSLLVVPFVAVVVAFANPILLIWTGRANIATSGAPILAVLALGCGLNGLMGLPLSLQLAYGWTRLSIYKNIVAVVLVTPLLFFLVARYGAIGAAITWVVLNAGYFLLEVPVMHRRILRTEMWRWYFIDVARPVLPAVLITSAMYWRFSVPSSVSTGLLTLSGFGLLALLGTAAATPLCWRLFGERAPGPVGLLYGRERACHNHNSDVPPPPGVAAGYRKC